MKARFARSRSMECIRQGDATARQFSVRRLRSYALAWLVLAVALPALASAQEPRRQPRERVRVELEVFTEPGFPVGGQQRWLSLLREVDFDRLRIRGYRTGDELEIRERAAGAYLVIGALTNQNSLELPGASFRPTDRRGMNEYVERLREEGPAAFLEPEAAFGLTTETLVAIHEQLTPPVDFETRGLSSRVVVNRLAAETGIVIEIDDEARDNLNVEQPVLDELQGLSHGTAMAAVLRPLGLVLVPARSRGESLLRIRRSEDSEESWPLGWPNEQAPGQVTPSLFKFLNVDIQETPLLEALAAIEERTEVPILFDHNALVRNRIDLSSAQADFPSRRTYYLRVVDDLLFEQRLRREIRMDEANRPFLWVTVIGQ